MKAWIAQGWNPRFYRWGPGSIPGIGIWQGTGRPSKIGDFLQVFRFLSPHKTTERQHLHLQERVYKFYKLSV